MKLIKWNLSNRNERNIEVCLNINTRYSKAYYKIETEFGTDQYDVVERNGMTNFVKFTMQLLFCCIMHRGFGQ